MKDLTDEDKITVSAQKLLQLKHNLERLHRIISSLIQELLEAIDTEMEEKK